MSTTTIPEIKSGSIPLDVLTGPEGDPTEIVHRSGDVTTTLARTDGEPLPFTERDLALKVQRQADNRAAEERAAETGRTLITGGNPDEPFPVPQPSHFFGDFMPAPELERVGEALIEHLPEFADIRSARNEIDIRTTYIWRKKAGKSADKVVAGKMGKVSGLTHYFAEVECIIQIAADAARGLTRWQMEAMLFHELKHIRVDFKEAKDPEDDDIPQLKVRGHDLELFAAEVERYGLWKLALVEGAKAFSNLPVFEQARLIP